MDSLHCGAIGVCALVLACDGSVQGDAGPDGNPNSCACSSGLDAACSADASVCPPSLGTAAFDVWAQGLIAKGDRAPICIQAADCPEMVMIVFGEGVDCASEYLYASGTNTLVALLHTCDGYVFAQCLAANACVPQRCMPSESASYSTPAACPSLPDAGTSD